MLFNCIVTTLLVKFEFGAVIVRITFFFFFFPSVYLEATTVTRNPCNHLESATDRSLNQQFDNLSLGTLVLLLCARAFTSFAHRKFNINFASKLQCASRRFTHKFSWCYVYFFFFFFFFIYVRAQPRINYLICRESNFFKGFEILYLMTD